MTHQEKIEYMRIASGIVGYSFDEKGLDLLVSLYELVREKKGETNLLNVCEIEASVKKRSELLDAPSVNVSLLPEAMEVIDNYLNAGCKETIKEASSKAKLLYEKYTGKKYENRNN